MPVFPKEFFGFVTLGGWTHECGVNFVLRLGPLLEGGTLCLVPKNHAKTACVQSDTTKVPFDILELSRIF